MTEREDASGVAQLTNALLECTAPITQILDHMARAPGAPDIDAAVGVLRSLLEDALAPLESHVPRADLVIAATVVDRATEAILSEILLVPHPHRGPANAGVRRGCDARRR
jgi:hypothetical protein